MKPHRPEEYFTYIMSNKQVITLYVGSTNNLIRRVWKHKHKYFNNSFTKKYNINKLLYFEKHLTREDAYKREKEIKGWTREKKIDLIKTQNPSFKDLSQYWWKGIF